MDIPVVTILLEGGLAAIRILKERLLEGISVVVIQSSGRAADLIAYASMNCRKDPEKYVYVYYKTFSKMKITHI